jgi:hypothetical protein
VSGRRMRERSKASWRRSRRPARGRERCAARTYERCVAEQTADPGSWRKAEPRRGDH